MAKHGKKYAASRAAVEDRSYPLDDGVALVKKGAYAKFDESVEVAMALGVDPKYADQMVRSTVVLPHGSGQSKRVAVIAQGDKLKEAEEAGADIVGGADLCSKIAEGFLDFDAVVTTPDMMRDVGKLGRVLGPRGLMPNPKAGTVTFDVAQAVEEIKAGKLEFRVDKSGIIHCAVGKVSFDEAALSANVRALVDAVLRVRPASAKGKYIKSLHIASTMGPGVEIDAGELLPK
jgi:large subunit ribosomal protein L1